MKLHYILLFSLALLLLFSNIIFSACSSDSDCPDGWSCTGAKTIVANCPDGKDCYGCEQTAQNQGGNCITDCNGICSDTQYAGLHAEECRQHLEQCEIQCGAKEKPTCPVYSDYDDCVSRCNIDDDMCAAYLGSCDAICSPLRDNQYDSAEMPSAGNTDVLSDECLSGCAEIYKSCISSCDGGSNSFDCQVECTKAATPCTKDCTTGAGQTKEECSLDCSVNICKEKTLLYDGFCEGGECKYYTFECPFGCSEDGSKCYKPEANTIAPQIELRFSKPSIVLNKKDSIKISAILKYQNGSPVRGAKVYFRIDDPKSSGVLGMWDFRDASKITDSSGEASGELELPNINSIKRLYWDEFPYSLDLEVKAFKHDAYDDWKAEASGQIEMQSPVPKISKISISPNPAQAYMAHNVSVEVQDVDSQKGFTYEITNYGGKWIKPKLGSCSGGVCTFNSDSLSQNLVWLSPARGLNADEIVFAREMGGNLEGLGVNLMFSAGEHYAKQQAQKLPGRLAKNVFYGYNIAKSGYNLAQNSKNIVVGMSDIYNSANWYERGYRMLDLTLEGAKTTVGVITLAGGEVPVLGQFGSAMQDVIDAGVGTVQAGLKSAAVREKIMAAQKLDMDMAFSVIVRDEDGNPDEEFYSFKMEYLGFDQKGENT